MVDLLKLIEDALVATRDVVQESIKSGCGLKQKTVGAYGDRSYAFDLLAERTIINVITDKLEDVAIISEELGVTGSGNPDYYVLIDPVDGSRNASRGIPIYSTTIVISKSNSSKDIIAGGVIDHVSGEVYLGERNGEIIVPGGKPKLSNVKSLKDSLLFLNTSSIRDERYRRWAEKIIGNCNHSSFLASTALEICYILAGRVDGYVCLGPYLRPFDFLAPVFILELAGGTSKILTVNGVVSEIELSAGREFGVIAASRQEVVDEISNLRDDTEY